MKYVIYLRVSDKDRQDERTQEQKCLSYLRQFDKTEFKYVVHTDKITSRKKLEDRPGIQSALEDLKKGDTLVAVRVDRLARNLYETTCIIYQLEKKDAHIILIDQPGIKNKVLLGLYAGIAEEEVKTIRKRIKEKLDAKKERSERISGVLPYGYQLDPNILIPIKQKDKTIAMKPGLLVPKSEEQEALSTMVQWFHEGISYRKIAKGLSELGYTNREGKSFHAMTVYKILSRRGLSRSEGRPLEETRALQFH